MNIKIVRLVSGEELVCELEIDEEKKIVIVKRPIVFVLEPTEKGIIIRGVMPWSIQSTTTEFVINKQHIVSIYEPKDEFRRIYDEKFGSGLVLPAHTLQVGN